jgi:hypothetical protein
MTGLREVVVELGHYGDPVVLEGSTHLITIAAHEIR